jgi:rubrerythrin
MEQNVTTYYKGDLVPQRGRYRCSECGEVWEATEINVRFPPCDANKSGEASWTRIADDSR